MKNERPDFMTPRDEVPYLETVGIFVRTLRHDRESFFLVIA
jgi:hypothetical protein